MIELRFTDTYGQTWHRDKQGVLARVQPDDDTAGSGSQSRAKQITPEFEATVAQAVGPAVLLLDRMDPVRVTINVGNAEVEEARWKELTQQVYAARERLLIIAAGHPRQYIRKLADQNSSEAR